MDQNNNYRGALWGSISLWLLFYGCGTAVDRAMVAARTEQLFSPSTSSPAAQSRQDTELPEKPTLQDYIRVGLLRNPDLRADYERWRAALERIPQVSSLPDPKLSYGHFIEEVQTRTGPQRNRFGLSQTFPWFGKLRLRGDVAALEAESLWWEVEDTRLTLVRDIKNAFFEYAYLAQAIRITDDNLQLLKRLEPVAQRKVAGGGGQEDLLRLQVEIGKVENDAESLRKLRPAVSARLAAAIDRQERQPLPWPRPVEPQVFKRSVEQLLHQLHTQNPTLESLRQRILSAQSQKELADLDGWPDITVGADYLETGSAIAPGTRGSG
ncbi:MAG: TolC family protein, partial [Planctomycetota bacterium]